jgi:hypothetical protein
VHQWLMPIILPTQKAEIRRIAVRRQLGQSVLGNIENTQHKKGLVDWLKLEHSCLGSGGAQSLNPSTSQKKGILFIVLKYARHKIYHYNHFYVCCSIVISIFT